MQVFMVGCKISLVKKQIVVYLKKNKLTFLLNCSLRHSPRGGGGLKALADMFAKHVNFFWTATLGPLWECIKTCSLFTRGLGEKTFFSGLGCVGLTINPWKTVGGGK